MTTLPLPAADIEPLVDLARKSHEIITTQQHPSGAYPACPTFSAYRGYAWFRDGAFTAEGISRYGDVLSADRFHHWASGILESRREHVGALITAAKDGQQIPLEDMLPTRFKLNGDSGDDEWWDFQTDGYGTWLWGLVAHAQRHDLDLEQWRGGAELCVDYLTTFWDRPCYDWWEEHLDQRHVSTLGAIYGGLEAAAAAGVLDPNRTERATEVVSAIRMLVEAEGVRDGHLTKWLGSTEVDASLAACVVPFGLVEAGGPLANLTLDTVTRDLDVDGGVSRFRADVFYGGGQWPLLAAFLGWNRANQGDGEAAWRYLRWMAAQASPQGELPEQVPTHLLAPGHRQKWIEQWGPVATPLLWSHGMYLTLADELGVLQ